MMRTHRKMRKEATLAGGRIRRGLQAPTRPFEAIARRSIMTVLRIASVVAVLSGVVGTASVGFADRGLGAVVRDVAFGGPGVTACRDAACLDREYRVLAVLEVTNGASAVVTPSTVARVEVIAADGSIASASRAVAEFVVLPTGTRSDDATFAPGVPFDGAFAPGTTRLRLQTWMTTRPPAGARVRIRIGERARSIVLEGVLPPYEWPTG